MTGPLGNSDYHNVSRDEVEGNKIHCSPRDQSLRVNYSPLFRWIIVNYLKRVAQNSYRNKLIVALYSNPLPRLEVKGPVPCIFVLY